MPSAYSRRGLPVAVPGEPSTSLLRSGLKPFGRNGISTRAGSGRAASCSYCVGEVEVEVGVVEVEIVVVIVVAVVLC